MSKPIAEVIADLTADAQRAEEASASVYFHHYDKDNLAKDIRALIASHAELTAQLTAGPDKVLRCAFCGEPYPEGTPDHKHEALTAHIRVCTVHPVGIENRALRADRTRLDCIQAYHWQVSFNERCDGFIVQRRDQVVGNIGCDRDVRAAIDKARKETP